MKILDSLFHSENQLFLYLFFFVIYNFLFFSNSLAQGIITCDRRDGPGRVLKSTIPDAAGNKFNLYCVNGSYFQGEIMRADGTPAFDFAKCTFTSGNNCFVPTFDVNNSFKRIVYFNIDVLKEGCAKFKRRWTSKRGETVAETEARLRQELRTCGCNVNIYSINFSPAIQYIEVYDAGELVDSINLTPEEATIVYDKARTPYPFMIEDSTMALPYNCQTAWFGKIIEDDFETSVIDSNYNPLTNSTQLKLSEGNLNIKINGPGDGIVIQPPIDLEPVCVLFDELKFNDFENGNGVGFETEFEEGDIISAQLFQTNSVTMKVVHTDANGVRSEHERHFEDIDLKDVKSAQVDWLPGDKVAFEIKTTTGPPHPEPIVENLSPFSHVGNPAKAYKIKGLDISTDPLVCIGSIAFSEVHVKDPPVVVARDTTIQIEIDMDFTLDPMLIDAGSFDPEGGDVFLTVQPSHFTSQDTGTHLVELHAFTDHGCSSAKAFLTIDLITKLDPVMKDTIGVKFYPNPMKDLATISFANHLFDSDVYLRIIDIHGRTLMSQAIRETYTQIKRGILIPGLYLFVLESEGRILSSGKFVVE